MSADFKGQNILIIAERGPQGLQTLSVHVGFFVVLLKEQWLGEGETAFLPGWQRLHSHSNASVCTAALPALGCVQPQGFPSSESTAQHWKHDQGRGAPAVTCAEPWAGTEPSQDGGQCLALVAPYLPLLKQTAAGDRRGISTCQTPGSGYPNGIPSPENKHKFIILVWLWGKTHLACSANIQTEGVLFHAAVISAFMFTACVCFISGFFHSVFYCILVNL